MNRFKSSILTFFLFFNFFQTHFKLITEDKDVQKELTKVSIKGPKGAVNCSVSWKDRFAECRFTPMDPGSYTVTPLHPLHPPRSGPRIKKDFRLKCKV